MVHRTLASLMLLGTLVACAPVGQGGYYAGGPAYYGSGAPLYAGGYGRGSGYAPRYVAPSYGGWGGGHRQGFVTPSHNSAWGGGGYRHNNPGPGFGNSYSQSVPNPGGNFSLRSVQPGSEGRVGRMARDMLNR
ncbi:MAG TPA: hypothetical protein VEY31_06965 [Roseococcus sp.]|jgi:hypothetical protein|nr:hypothetical protein [Roseococcus sp.]